MFLQQPGWDKPNTDLREDLFLFILAVLVAIGASESSCIHFVAICRKPKTRSYLLLRESQMKSSKLFLRLHSKRRCGVHQNTWSSQNHLKVAPCTVSTIPLTASPLATTHIQIFIQSHFIHSLFTLVKMIQKSILKTAKEEKKPVK